MADFSSSFASASSPPTSSFSSPSYKNDIIFQYISQNELKLDEMEEEGKAVDLESEEFNFNKLNNPFINKKNYFFYYDLEISPNKFLKSQNKPFASIIKKTIHNDPLLCFFICDTPCDKVLKDIKKKKNSDDLGQSNQKKIQFTESLRKEPCIECQCLPKFHRSDTPSVSCVIMKGEMSKYDPNMNISEKYCISCL